MKKDGTEYLQTKVENTWFKAVCMRNDEAMRRHNISDVTTLTVQRPFRIAMPNGSVVKRLQILFSLLELAKLLET